MPRRRTGAELAGGVTACCNPKAGSVVAAAEAAPRMRMNDLRETPCVVSKFIKGSPRKVDFCRYATPWRQKENPTEDDLNIPCKNKFACSNYSFGSLNVKMDRRPIEFNLPRIASKCDEIIHMSNKSRYPANEMIFGGSPKAASRTPILAREMIPSPARDR
jgi:hypothetical protein